MSNCDHRPRPFLLLLPLLLLTPQAWAKDAPKKPAAPTMVRTQDYGKWEQLGRRITPSPDGKWIAYTVKRNDGESLLHLRAVSTDGAEKFKYGASPHFGKDGRWLAFRIGVSPKEQEKLKKIKKPAKSKLGLHDLAKGKTEEIDDIESFTFSDDGRFLVMRRYKPTGQGHGGRTVLVRDLSTGRDTAFGNVSKAAWMEEGPLLALVIDAEKKSGNGVQVYNALSGRLRTLDSANLKYSTLTWRKEADDLAVLRDREHASEEDDSYVVLTWRGLMDDKVRSASYDHMEDETFPKDMRIVDQGGLHWTEDGATVFFGIKSWKNKPKPKKSKSGKGGASKKSTKSDKSNKPTKGKSEKDCTPEKSGTSAKSEKPDESKKGGASSKSAKAKGRAGKKAASPAKKGTAKTLRESLEEPAGVDVWHPKDIDIQPRQKKLHSRRERESHLAAWWIDDDRFVRLGDDKVEKTQRAKRGTHAIGRDLSPYEIQQRFGPTLADLYVVDTKTGKRKRMLEANKYQLGSSPDGRYLLYVKEKQLWTYDCAGGVHTNLTKDCGANCINQEVSTLTDEKPPYGLAGWSEDGQYVFIYGRYDIWQFRADGSTKRRLTHGAEQNIRHRRVVLDRKEDEFVRADRPMIISLYGDRSKKSGYARLRVLGAERAPVERLLWRDARVSGLVKAEDADVYAYTVETFSDSPDVFVAGASLADGKQLSKTNPFQKDYTWGHSELIDYKSADGQDLQGALFYPAGYEKGKQYPMIVDIYELRSQALHRYRPPTERYPYSNAVFSTQGYFVLMPDIVYRAQNPGLSAVDCVLPAVKRVLEKGDVDPQKVGLVGHSWGAYQTAFLVTQTDMFAAGVAGAPLTNMISMAGNVYWNSGQANAWIFQESQGRMDRPFWQDVETYIKNSPIFHIDKMDTPLLVAFGDKDGAVDWHQGIEMYNAARLAQKPMVMLVYAGENHGLRKKPNQVDYHHRVREWFDHYLKGVKAPKWITDGVSHKERQAQLEKRKKDKKKKKGKRGKRKP